MAKKSFNLEQIAMLRRQIEAVTSQGMSIPVACRKAGISDRSVFPLAQGAWRF